jgi:hypothetical protein
MTNKLDYNKVDEWLGLVFSNQFLKGYAAGMGAPIKLLGGEPDFYDFNWWEMADFLIAMGEVIKEARLPHGILRDDVKPEADE